MCLNVTIDGDCVIFEQYRSLNARYLSAPKDYLQ